ncbi:MAG: hypothetical protein H7343_18205 [Undibacterium sp.]|nr:hypothetical protein [Opitutaceae bacterium]
MKKKFKLNGKIIDVRRIAFQPVPSQPVPRQFDLIRDRRVRYLKFLGLSNSQIANGVLGDRKKSPLVVIVGRRIHESAAEYEGRVTMERAAPGDAWWMRFIGRKLGSAEKREKKFIELALESLAAAIEGKRLWIKGEYSFAAAQMIVMTVNEARLQLGEIEAKERAKGREVAHKNRNSNWDSLMVIARDFVAGEKQANRQRPSVKDIYNHVCAVVESGTKTGGRIGAALKSPGTYQTFAGNWRRLEQKLSFR